MAKSSAPPDSAAILKGLRKALGGPRPLNGDGEEALFPKGAAGKKLADAAEIDGYLIVREEKTGHSKKAVKKGELTEKGRTYVLSEDNPKPVLESLLLALRRLGDKSETPGAQSAFEKIAEKAKADCAKVIEQAFAKQHDVVAAALAKLDETIRHSLATHKPTPPADAGPALSALEATLHRVSAPPQPVAAPTLPSPSSPKFENADLGNAIVNFVELWAKEKSVGPPFDAVWNHLKKSHPEISVGEFQDALRTLHDARRIHLSGWSGIHDEIPKQELAFFVSRKVMYYAHPAHSYAG